MQVLQAANTGITSLQKLVDTAKSIANQVLQAPVGYSTKTSVTSGANAGATATNLLGATLAQSDILTIAATGGGTATSITFGTGAAEVDTLTELNAALAANNLQARWTTPPARSRSPRPTMRLRPPSARSAAPRAGAGKAFLAASAPGRQVADAASQPTRANLVKQYNNIIPQITTTAQDASFNGINLLNGDNLKLIFNETGKSTLSITGVTFNAAGLGLASLTAAPTSSTTATNKVIAALNTASSSLRSQASSLGSNLSIVQIRQDFSKNLINVLQTGSSNLTLADTNEEAANSQALSTRQSIAVSALALANQSQQSVLQLLR